MNDFISKFLNQIAYSGSCMQRKLIDLLSELQVYIQVSKEMRLDTWYLRSDIVFFLYIVDFLHFTKNITDLDHVRARQFVYLDCCASGYDTITWYFMNNNTKYSWKEFPFLYQECEHNDECPTLSSENQTLLILKATVGYDNGSYICVAHNSSTGQNISHLEDLLVVGIEFCL